MRQSMFKLKAILRSMTLIIVVLMLRLPAAAMAKNTANLDFVYGTNHFNGATYNSTFIPPMVDRFYLLANKTSMLAARYTQLYYWPITNQYKADWGTANVIVQGDIEIIQGSKIIQTVALTDYVIQYDGNNKIDTTTLYLGADAIAARKNYESLQAKYRDDLFAYYKKSNEFTSAYQAALAELQKGNITEDQMPIAPTGPDDFSLFSTDLLKGFPINLPNGDYDIRLRLPDGTLQPNSQKHLVVFDSLGEGIGYKISAEARWNFPEISSEEEEIIYGLKDGTYFIQPVHQKLFNELYYTHMNNPQDKSTRIDRTLWVTFRSAENVTLSVLGQSGTTQVNLQSYYVQQILGTKLGYEIRKFDPMSMSQPSFTGFKLTLDNSLVYSISLLDKNGSKIAGSTRQVRILNTDRTWPIYLVGTFPLIIGIGLTLLRKKKVRDIKVVG